MLNKIKQFICKRRVLSIFFLCAFVAFIMALWYFLSLQSKANSKTVSKENSSQISSSFSNQSQDVLSSTVSASTIPAESVDISSASLKLNKGDETQLSASVMPADSTETPVWTSTDKYTVSVDQTGKIKALVAGFAVIKVSIGTVSAKCQVTVSDPNAISSASKATTSSRASTSKSNTSSYINANYAGYLSIPNTKISTPVVLTTNNDYYLSHDYYDNYNKQGTVFMDFRNSKTEINKNTILYGHNADNGVMFANLLKFKDESYLRAHPTITFHFINAAGGTWQIFSVFSVEGNSEGTGEKECRYITTDFSSDQDFLNFANEMKSWSYVDLGVSISATDHILTLSTCDHSVYEGRMAVMAKLIS